MSEFPEILETRQKGQKFRKLDKRERIHVDAPPLQTMPPENQERPGGGKEKFGFVTDPLL
jgi:hypothetical protein